MHRICFNASRVTLSNPRDGTKHFPAAPLQGPVAFLSYLGLFSLLSLLRESPFHQKDDGTVIVQMPCSG